MRYVSIVALALVLGACGRGEVVSTDTAETDTGVAIGTDAVTDTYATTDTSTTITPGTSQPAPTATGTIAPEPATRTTTSAPPGATGT
jgi:hypothetical protein